MPNNPIENSAYKVNYVKNRIENERIENLQLTSSLGYKLDYESIQNKLGFMQPSKVQNDSHSSNSKVLVKTDSSQVKIRTISQSYVQNRKKVAEKKKQEEEHYKLKHKRTATQ